MRRLITLIAATLAACAALASAAQAKPPFYGVVTQTLLTEEDYALMESGGVESLRVQFSWSLVQPQEGRCQASAQTGVCDWSLPDRLVGNLAARGIETFPYLLNTPPWLANDQDKPPVRSKEARDAWGAWVEAAAKRYGPGGTYWETQYLLDHPLADPVPIRNWQIWNEPSAQPFWKPKPKVREYAKLVKLSANALRAADPDAYVVLAGLFGTPTVGITQPEFIRSLYKVNGIERYFDAVAIHPYGPDLDRVKFQVDWALDEIKRAGDRNADLWISEIGWASDRVHNQLGVGKKKQAQLLERSFELFRSKRKAWNLVAVDWYAWQDVDGENFCDFCRRSGLVNVEGQPKLAYDAFQEQAAK
jgi:polysaccharide biosynthesis protein PslG